MQVRYLVTPESEQEEALLEGHCYMPDPPGLNRLLTSKYRTYYLEPEQFANLQQRQGECNAASD